jgi:glycine/D-amino acid oxidase-like deaminating enzyme
MGTARLVADMIAGGGPPALPLADYSLDRF